MADDLFEIESSEHGPSAIILRVRVQPGAGRSAVTGRHGDALALRVAAPPIEGRANAQCIELVAEVFGVRKSQVELVAGDHSRQKRLRITGLEPAHARDVIVHELRATTGRPGSNERAERPGRSRP
jgi:uncharacterized protein (TIGR00251 family)